MAEFVSVLKTGEVSPGEMKVVTVGDTEIVVANAGGRLCAFRNLCPHEEGPLSEGTLEGTIVTCPWHFSRFDVTTGEIVDGVTDDSLTVYELRVVGDSVEVAKP
ncbi:MAG: Rieske 2Fe-2S domain-containing protein [Bauldia sp.]|nr:Rieske 2Fe-2S domain-containing protein [Bauldia sp.]